MINKIFNTNNVNVSIYYYNDKDCLRWHAHPISHSHCVIKGSTKVEIENQESIICTEKSNNIELPEILKHQITALEDNTIFVNIITPSPLCPYYINPITGQTGGVQLEDGTIVYGD